MRQKVRDGLPGGGALRLHDRLENVAFPLREHAQAAAEEIARAWSEKLAVVGLGGRSSALPGRALRRHAQARRPGAGPRLDPQIVLYDEPTTGLDPITTDYVDEMILDARERLTSEMVRCAERLTDAQLDEPIELNVDDDHQTIRSLLSRLVGQMGMWNAAMANRDYDWSVEEHESRRVAARTGWPTEGATYLSHVRDVADRGRLDDTFVDALCEPAEVFTYGGMIAHVLTFAAHRRCLVVMALGKHGITELGWGDPMRWVAERHRAG